MVLDDMYLIREVCGLIEVGAIDITIENAPTNRMLHGIDENGLRLEMIASS